MNGSAGRRTVVACAAFLLLSAITSMARPQEIPAGAWAGKWKLDPSRSKFPGAMPKEDRLIIEPDGTVKVHEVSAEGRIRNWGYKPEAGRAVPVQGHGENVTVLVKELNPDTMAQFWNYNGKKSKSYATLSKDHEIQTFHVMRTTSDGKPFEEVLVFTRQ